MYAICTLHNDKLYRPGLSLLLSMDRPVGPEHAARAAHFPAQLTGVATVHYVARLHVLEHVAFLFPIVATVYALPTDVQLWRNKIEIFFYWGGGGN